MSWLQNEIVQMWIRKALTSVAVAFVTHGVIKSGQQTQFVEIGSGAVVWALMGIIGYFKAKQHQAVNMSVADNKGKVPDTVTAAAQPTNIIGGTKTPNGLP